MAKMRAVQISRQGGPLELIEREIPKPGPGQVRLKVQACGVCHSDSFVQAGGWPGLQFPRIPGHEVIGVIDSLGPNVPRWKVGDRVGVGWHGGHCGYCDQCERANFFGCQVDLKVTGISFDGGYAEYMIAPANVLAVVPKELSSVEAAPLMCAGVTTYNALRHTDAMPGDLVAILGLGGLGHLAVQFAAKMGFKTVAIARGKDKKDFALKLGAHHYIDSEASDAAKELQKLGGATVILATAANSEVMSAVQGGLGINGSLVVVGKGDDLKIDPAVLITGSRSVKGWSSGVAIDSQDTLNFCVLTGVRSMNEVFTLERAQEAYDKMMSGKVRFRAVLKME